MKLAATVLASLIALAPAARADDQIYGPAPAAAPAPPAPPMPNPRAGFRQLLLQRFDRNGDGRLEPNERRHAARALRRLAHRLALEDRRDAREAGMRRKLIERYDLDGDGNVGPGEMPPAMARRLRRLDRNGDGWLDGADAGR